MHAEPFFFVFWSSEPWKSVLPLWRHSCREECLTCRITDGNVGHEGMAPAERNVENSIYMACEGVRFEDRKNEGKKSKTYLPL